MPPLPPPPSLFPMHTRLTDGTSMLLVKAKALTHIEAPTAKSTEKLRMSQRWTKNWQTTNKSDFCQHSLH